MAIVAGDLIIPAFFQDQDTDGTYTGITMKNNNSNFNFSKDGTNLVRFVKDASNPGDIDFRGDWNDNEDI